MAQMQLVSQEELILAAKLRCYERISKHYHADDEQFDPWRVLIAADKLAQSLREFLPPTTPSQEREACSVRRTKTVPRAKDLKRGASMTTAN